MIEILPANNGYIVTMIDMVNIDDEGAPLTQSYVYSDIKQMMIALEKLLTGGAKVVKK